MGYPGRPTHSSQQPNESQITANGGHHGQGNINRPGSAPNAPNNSKLRPSSPG